MYPIFALEHHFYLRNKQTVVRAPARVHATRIAMRPHRALLALASIAAVVAASCLSTAAASPDPSLTDLLTGADETFREEALVRPLRDGRVALVASFEQTAPLSKLRFVTFPNEIAAIVRAAQVADMELSFTRVRRGSFALARFPRDPVHHPSGVRRSSSPPPPSSRTQGRWDYRRWGRPPVGAKPIGAELIASFFGDDDPAELRGRWENVTTMLGGVFCASLSRMQEAAEAKTAPKLAFHQWDGGPDATASARPITHASLPAEAVCTENLSPWLKLLPCRDDAGVAATLRSRAALFGSGYVSFSVRARVVARVSTRISPGEWGIELTQRLTTVLEPGWTEGPDARGPGWTLSELTRVGETLGRPGLPPACAAANSSSLHVETISDAGAHAAEAHVVDANENARGGGGGDGGDFATPAISAARSGSGDGAPTTKSFDLARVRDGTRYDVTVRAMDAPSLPGGDAWRETMRAANTPELYAERIITGSGYHRGGMTVELRRPSRRAAAGATATRARVLQVLPWYVRAFVHTLVVEIDGVPVPLPSGRRRRDDDEDDDARGVVEGLRWVPAIDRARPSSTELQLLIPSNATVARVSIGFEKAFLHTDEFPPDANRGFDIPAAVITLPPPRTRTRVRGSDGGDGGDGGERSPLLDAVARRGEWNAAEVMYTDGSLLPWPTPDFSMPFNIITMTSTVMALLSGLMMRELTARHGWRTGERAKNARRARREREAKKMAKRAALLRRLRACAIS